MAAIELKQALEQIKKGKERKFNQTVDLIINLKGLDLKKHNISLIVSIPNTFQEKKVCGFLTNKSELVDTISKQEFTKYKDKTALKKLVKKYDFFIAHASLMPSVAVAFGKVLGPAGKMPSPQLGIIMQETPEEIEKTLSQISKSIKIRIKEGSVKVAAGKFDMGADKIEENIKSVYERVVNSLPTKQENVKNVLVKLTMDSPVEVKLR